MKIIEVTSRRHVKEFLQLPVRLYKSTPAWIRPLDKDIEQVFDREKNNTFRHGDCVRWILQNDRGETIGRVAAFYNEKIANKDNDQPTGGMGFFECINDKKAAFMLFDQCRTWLEAHGMEAMDGPVNFGSRDRWWGLLLEGFDIEPNYQCNYNFPYYRSFFEEYGFQVYFYQLTYGREVGRPVSERLYQKASMVAQDSNYEFRHIRKDEIPRLAEYIHHVYNKAWGGHAGAPELTLAQARHIVRQMKPIMDIHLLYFGFYKGEPIAFFLSLPEINQIFKYVNGKLDVIGKLKFLWHTFLKTNQKAFGILFGVAPEHQGKGVDGALIMEGRRVLQDEYKRYHAYEMNWIGDFNPKMINVVEQVGAEVVKR